MPSRASNAELMVDSRAARDIGLSLRQIPVAAGGKLCRDLGPESQGSPARACRYREEIKPRAGARPTSMRGSPDGTRHGAANTVIAVFRIVQPVPRHQRAGRQAGSDRVAHQLKSRKQSDMFLACDVRNHRLHLGMRGGGQNLTGILLVHQNDIRSLRLQGSYASGHQFVEAPGLTAPGDVIGPELPDNEIRPVRENVALNARDAAGNGVPDPAA